MNIGDRIRKRREELGLTQLELALKVGYTSKSTITRIEKGSNQLKQTKILQFAKALDTTPAYLIGWDENDTEDVLVEPCEPDHLQLLAIYLSQLNDDGFSEALKRIEELTELEKYKKED